ncbi:Alpha-N-acetylneuraminide alpha-2,8-sialyltransferase [Myotis brandtii]|uniref:Alpha-N-acetylneuraminide alpha-2,8-sialyltransferase n=1 Tax=Myotis brandtii TaxID=109478 RepID=S7PN63_MYOBR|nr:Alpha-N-acetylneuraminide alpha-2,8-sialyltransferase [Myotis brandtii]
MSPCGRARRHTSRGAMAVLAWKFPRTRLPVGASALCVVVLCWLYIFPVYRLPNEKEIVQAVLQQGTAWKRNQTAARLFSLSFPFLTWRLEAGALTTLYLKKEADTCFARAKSLYEFLPKPDLQSATW